jgi:CheY-like chemotaxis protein
MVPAQGESRQGPRPRLARLRVLVVDDEPDTVITLLEILRDEGHDACGFSHPLEALKALDDYDPDVVISDIAMPLMSGWEFARKVRQKMGDARPMLVAISGVYQKSSDEILATLAGYQFFLSKPCEPAAVLGIVEKARGPGGA